LNIIALLLNDKARPLKWRFDLFESDRAPAREAHRSICFVC
jgi:hypothetical protein